MKRILPQFASAFVVLVALFGNVTAKDLTDEEIASHSNDIMFGIPQMSAHAQNELRERGNPDVVPLLTMAVRYRGPDPSVLRSLSMLTGEDIGNWRDAMLWQEAHPEVQPHSSYRALKLDVLNRIDPNFSQFLGENLSLQENLDIRLEEITWGGVKVDGIPSLDNPELIPAADADYLADNDLVFGVEINGDARAYPLRIMGWHEMFNETIGGVPVALAYCTLCGAGILFETLVEGQDEPLVFGSSGFLYRSNKLMFDRKTNSLWNQFTGKPVSGQLRTSGIELKIRPNVITSWKNWKKKNPDTRVLSLKTGHNRDYGSGVVYQDYFASPDLMFPTLVRDESKVKRKDYVFGIRDVAASKAWPIAAFEGGKVINDKIGGRNVVVIGDRETLTVRAYDRDGFSFEKTDDPEVLKGFGGNWGIEEARLMGPNGEELKRVPGHLAFWFAWDGYLGIESELYEG
ncbi:MAG: DUF3179 domain-containing protein [Hyphomicrobiales bacterium]